MRGIAANKAIIESAGSRRRLEYWTPSLGPNGLDTTPAPILEAKTMDQKNPQQDDRYARNSFGMRGMTRWQRWGITIAAVVVLVLLLSYMAGWQ
jgi:hypothetical protein